MKNILFAINLIFCVTNFYNLQCSDFRRKVSGRKRTSRDHEDSNRPVNKAQVSAIIQDFTKQYRATIIAFIASHPERLYRELQSFRPTENNGVLAFWNIEYDRETKLYCSKKYTSNEIQNLPIQQPIMSDFYQLKISEC